MRNFINVDIFQLFDEDSPTYDLNVDEGRNDDLNESGNLMV